ncbi:8750_t:CDS:2, partial [Entrophospora sp. SA101]
MSYELRDQVSKYIGFNPEEIRLPVTDEDRQLFQELIADQEKMIDIVMDEYRFLLHHGHNYKGGESIHIMWVYICTEKDAEKVLIDLIRCITTLECGYSWYAYFYDGEDFFIDDERDSSSTLAQ